MGARLEPALSAAAPLEGVAWQRPRLVAAAPWARRRRRIVVVIHDFALGGTERVAVRMAGEWARSGCDVRLFAGAVDGPLRTLLDPAVTVVGPDRPIRRGPGSQRALATAAADHLHVQPADACFVPGNYHWPVAAAVTRLPHHLRPVVLAQISAALRKPQRGWLAQAAFDVRMRWLLRHVDALLAMCDDVRETADRILRRRVAITMPLPALDDAAPRPLRPAAGHHVLAAGRLVPEKGFDTLIEAFARVAARDCAAQLAIVGEGPDRDRLMRLAAALGIADRVALPGYVADIRPWLDRARVFVLSSRFEGYGAVVVEALAAGRPVILTDCTPAAALLAGEAAGRIVPIADPVAMAGAITALLDEPAADPARLAALVDHHRIGEIARAHLDLIERLIADRATQPRMPWRWAYPFASGHGAAGDAEPRSQGRVATAQSA